MTDEHHRNEHHRNEHQQNEHDPRRQGSWADQERTRPIPGPITPSSSHQSGSQHTNPYPWFFGSAPEGVGADPATGHRMSTATAPPPRRRGRAGTAGLLAAALLVGGAAGVGGAYGYDELQGNPATPLNSATSSNLNASTATSTSPTRTSPKGSPETVAAEVLPSVVKINVVGQSEAGSGSGVILTADGEILTNNHVVALAGNGGQITVNFNDGSTAKATVVGTDPVTDLAVVKAEGVSGLTPATLGNSNALKVGQEVLAVGSPFGLEATVTSGIVSSLNRPVSVGNEPGVDSTTYPAIQTDAAINPGNSGGPLVNLQGQVVGINSSIRSVSTGMSSEAGSIGLGFAIPLSKVLPVVEQLRSGETPTHAMLGVRIPPSQGTETLTTTVGAKILRVDPGSAAQKAGLEAGDVVTKIDGQTIDSVESLVATIRGYRPGDTVTLTIERDGQTKTLTATLDSDTNSGS